MAKALGERESAILAWIAAHAPASVSEVALEFERSHGLARTTLLTVMERLRAKGFLMREKVAGVFRYAPSEPHSDQMRDLVSRFVERSLGGNLEPFVAYLSTQTTLSDAEKAQLRQLVRDLDESESDESESDESESDESESDESESDELESDESEVRP